MQRSLVLVLALTACFAERLRNRRQDPDDPMTAFDVSCYVVADQGLSYRGLVSTTFSGRSCQKWVDQKPWTISLTPTEDNGLGDHNYCRNPDGSQQMPWCYTLDTNPDHEIETCAIPECPPKARDFSAEASTLATEVEATDCECAEQLYGSTVTTKQTEVALTLAQANHTAKKRCRCAAALQVANKTGAKANTASGAAPPQPDCSATVVDTSVKLQPTITNVVHGKVELCGEGQLKVQEGNCPISGQELPNATLKSNGGESGCQTVTCDAYPCCMAVKCGSSSAAWER